MAPNSVFGPATLASVQKFQSANSISATGYVGHITRLAIKIKSCESVRVESIPETVTRTPVQSDSTPRSSVSIISPRDGDTLTIGKSHIIKWGKNMSISDSLVLDSEDGIARGYIAFFPGTAEEYVWDVGRISVGNSTETIEPGRYRIRVQDKLRGVSVNDPKSNIFTIIAPDLSVSSIKPSGILPDGRASAVLFGSGFMKNTRMYLDGPYQNEASVLFVSPDGTILVFSIPSTVPRGLHRIVLRTSYGTITTDVSVRVN